MELKQILDRFADGLHFVDSTTSIINANAKTGKYRPGLTQLHEDHARDELVMWWKDNYPTEFKNPGCKLRDITEIKYPENKRKLCDIVFSPQNYSGGGNEWAIEFKYIRFIGDNGKKNPYGAGKFLSPYMMETSLITDLIRLQKSKIASRKAVIGFSFNYSFDSLAKSIQKHPNMEQVHKNMQAVLKSNDSISGVVSIDNLLEIVNFAVRKYGLQTEAEKSYFDAWRNPTGGNGVVFGWEV
jgi:hypothetical protein